MDRPKRPADKYEVITAADTSDLETEVSRLMKEGYRPQGGISVVWDQSEEIAFYFQAMIGWSE